MKLRQLKFNGCDALKGKQPAPSKSRFGSPGFGLGVRRMSLPIGSREREQP
jgi:hypothetical protein